MTSTLNPSRRNVRLPNLMSWNHLSCRLFAATLALAPLVSLTHAQSADPASPVIRSTDSAEAGSELFAKSVAPVLIARCLACHRDAKSEGGYSLETPRSMLNSGDSGKPPVIAGKASTSEMWRRITATDEAERMPVEGPALNKEQVAAITRWIDLGAPVATEHRGQSLEQFAASMPAGAPLHYPRPLPIHSLVLAAGTVFVGGYAEVTGWDVNTHQLVARIPVAGTHVLALALSPDKKWLAVASGSPGLRGQVEVISAGSQHVPRIALRATADIAADLAFAPDGRLAVAGHDGKLTLVTFAYDPLGINKTEERTPHADSIMAVAWTDDGNRLATTSRDRTAKLFDGSSGELIVSYDRHERAVGGVGFWGKRLLSLDETGRLRLMSGEEDDRVAAEITGLPRNLQHLVTANSILLTYDRQRLRRFEVSKSIVEEEDKEGKVKRREVVRLQELAALTAPNGKVLISASNDGATIAAGSETGEVWIWNQAGQLLTHFRVQP